MGMFCINKSGKTVNVWAGPCDGEVVGVINPNECYTYVSRWNGSHIYEPSAVCDYIMFRHNGELINGWIINTGDGLETSVLNYSYPNVTVSGVSYKCLKTRVALKVHDSDGNYIGTCPSGARVLTNNSQPGMTMNHLVSAKYYETGYNTGIFQPIYSNGSSGTVGGFIDSGLWHGSMYNTIGLYGNW